MRLETVYEHLKESFDPEFDEPLKSFPIFLADELESIEQVLSNIRECQVARLDEEARHKEKLREIDGRLLAAQFKCNHYASTYYGDASGGSDSHTECDICGAEL